MSDCACRWYWDEWNFHLSSNCGSTQSHKGGGGGGSLGRTCRKQSYTIVQAQLGPARGQRANSDVVIWFRTSIYKRGNWITAAGVTQADIAIHIYKGPSTLLHLTKRIVIASSAYQRQSYISFLDIDRARAQRLFTRRRDLVAARNAIA